MLALHAPGVFAPAAASLHGMLDASWLLQRSSPALIAHSDLAALALHHPHHHAALTQLPLHQAVAAAANAQHQLAAFHQQQQLQHSQLQSVSTDKQAPVPCDKVVGDAGQQGAGLPAGNGTSHGTKSDRQETAGGGGDVSGVVGAAGIEPVNGDGGEPGGGGGEKEAKARQHSNGHKSGDMVLDGGSGVTGAKGSDGLKLENGLRDSGAAGAAATEAPVVGSIDATADVVEAAWKLADRKASLGLGDLAAVAAAAACAANGAGGAGPSCGGASAGEEGYFNVEDMLRSNTPALR
jgi:hypothetical protein